MRVKNMAWTFDKAFSKETCDKIIEHGLAQKSMKAKTGTGNVSINRDSEITWLYDQWIIGIINPYVNLANKQAEWNFQWEPVPQLQFTKYGKGQFYNWHRDTVSRPIDGKIRKLSVTVNLNDGYEGGAMYFDPEEKYGITTPIQNKKITHQGSICVFPSDMWHKVDTVTKGTRYSLVMWLLGDPWI